MQDPQPSMELPLPSLPPVVVTALGEQHALPRATSLVFPLRRESPPEIIAGTTALPVDIAFQGSLQVPVASV